MENTALSKYTISFGLSLALSSVINALLVVVKEKSHTVTTGLQKITGHQWVTHVAIILILFAFFGWLFASANHGQGLKMAVNRLAGIIVAGVVAGGLIITGFYLIAD
jgi:heme/copper-type cytochrome/quinol oxidase subunit 4